MNDDNRKVEIDSPDSFVPPDLLHYHPLYKTDISAVQSLTNSLTRSGAIELSRDGGRMVAESSFQDIYKEAALGAMYEKDLNPDYYHPEIENLVSDRGEIEDEWENPDIEAVDEETRELLKDVATNYDYD